MRQPLFQNINIVTVLDEHNELFWPIIENDDYFDDYRRISVAGVRLSLSCPIPDSITIFDRTSPMSASLSKQMANSLYLGQHSLRRLRSLQFWRQSTERRRKRFVSLGSVHRWWSEDDGFTWSGTMSPCPHVPVSRIISSHDPSHFFIRAVLSERALQGLDETSHQV